MAVASPAAHELRTVRAFNRDVTRAIGVLEEHLHDTEFALPEARVIHELAQRDETPVADLRAALQLDSGYLSRLLSRLEARGVIERAKAPDDGRRQVARLTAAGRDAFAVLDERADVAAATLLEDRDDAARDRLVRAMGEVSAALGDRDAAAPPPAVVLRPASSGDWGWIVARNGAVYAREFGWDDRYEALVARIVADHIERRDPRREAAWIAEVDGERAGCVLCVAGDDERTAKLRLLLVEPTARGAGLGHRLVDEVIRFARRTGHDRLVLWTNSPLTGARHIYEEAGFRLTGEDAEEHRDFGPPMRGQTLELDLR